VRLSLTKYTLLAVGLALLLLAGAPGLAATAHAIPLAALTPTAEPPTRTSPPAPTATTVPTGNATATLPPRPTVFPTDTAPPTNTPKPRPTDDSKPERADPAVTKAVNVDQARIGDVVVFTLTVTNHGGETADDVVVTDTLPEFLDVVDANASKGAIAVDGRTVVITIGTVAPGEVIVIHIRARVNERAQPPGGRNSVTLTTSNNSDDPANDIDSVDITILPPSDTTATPAASAEAPTAGSPTVAPGAAAPTAVTRPPNLPNTGAADSPAGSSWPLALLGLAAIMLSLLIHRRAAAKG
jgi:uncharacterized repeat protein (TIGR01451 family)